MTLFPHRSAILLTACVLFSCAGVIRAPGETNAVSTELPDSWSDALKTVGTVRLDPGNKTLLVKGWVNQVVGAIELLACGPGGKTHESVLVFDLNPLDMQTGLLLLGYEPGRPPSGLGQGNPSGPKMALYVDWMSDGEKRTARAETFVVNVETRKVFPPTRWYFTGSVMEDGEFKALAEESLVCTFWDPWAILNIASSVGTNDELLIVNTNTVPRLHTPVVVRITEQ